MAKLVVNGKDIVTFNQPSSRAAYEANSSLALIGALVHPSENNFIDNDTTPDVSSQDHYRTANSALTLITFFDNGYDGQIITVRVDDVNTRFINSISLVLPDGVDIDADSGDFFTFQKIGVNWYLQSLPGAGGGGPSSSAIGTDSDFETEFHSTDETAPNFITRDTDYLVAEFPDGVVRETKVFHQVRRDLASSGNIEFRALVSMGTANAGTVDLSIEYRLQGEALVGPTIVIFNPVDSADILELTQVLLSIPVASVAPSELIVFKLKGDRAVDTHTGSLFVHGIEVRYPEVGPAGGLGSLETQFFQEFETTNEPSPIDATADTDYPVVRFEKGAAADQELKIIVQLSKEFNSGGGNVEFRLKHSMNIANAGTVELETEYRLEGGSIVGPTTYVLDPLDVADTIDLSAAVLSINGSLLLDREIIVFKLKRKRLGASDTHTGDLDLHGIEVTYPVFGGGIGTADYAGSFEQVATPTISQIPSGKWGFWYDTVNSRMYSMRNRSGLMHAVEWFPNFHKKDAVIRTYTAGVLVSDFVYQKSDGTVDKADATSIATIPAIGTVIQIDMPVAGQCVIQYDGDFNGFSGLTAGKIYLVSKSPGGIVAEDDVLNPNYPDDVFNIQQEVGIASSATNLFVAANRDFEEI